MGPCNGPVQLAQGMVGMEILTLRAAHKHCSRHRAELEASEICGCFYCLGTFSPSAISEWIDDGQTALCPKCPVDSVLGSASGYPITRDFLQRMHDYYF
jgi:hypothetical protein